VTFADELARIERSNAAAIIDSATPADVRRALATERLTERDLAALLSPAAEQMLDEIGGRARETTLRHFGRTIGLYAPLYLSNECENECAYCGFSAANRVPRATLSEAEAVAEAEVLRDRGFRHVLLLTGESPRALDEARLARIVALLRPMFASVSIEVFPMAEDGYRTMVAAGVDGLTLYQETYDRATYARLHRSGRKSDFDARLLAPERGAAAGMRRVGIGCLLGLADFRRDIFCAALHAAWLSRRYWRTHITVSFPRLRHAEGGFAAAAPVTDRQLALAICATRIFLPRAGLVLSTRETSALRDTLLPFGITQMSAGSCTRPGGYLHPEEAANEAQFSVEDHRTAEEVFAAIRSAGYDPAYKDWDAELAGGAR